MIVNGGIKEMNEKDDAMRTCLRAKTRDTRFVGTRKKPHLSVLGNFLCLIPMMMCGESYGIKEFRSSIDTFGPEADVVIDGLNPDHEMAPQADDDMNVIAKLVKDGRRVVHFAETSGVQRAYWNFQDCNWYYCRGNLSYITNDSETAACVWEWADTDQMTAPMCMADLENENADKLFHGIQQMTE